ncbi:MAG: Na-translocating system protein MpsB [Phycisphaerales bacterium]|nr:Na-translocating system protein MpsB [Phycisphaerales bacterium]
MGNSNHSFDEQELLHELKHYLPAQAPLKDFVHHNSLHAYQSENFFEALKNASDTFGYKTFLTLNEFRKLYRNGRINPEILDKVIAEQEGAEQIEYWKDKLIHKDYNENIQPNIGQLRAYWKKILGIDLESFVQPLLFRVLCSYLDQGISIWEFPLQSEGFLATIRAMEKNSKASFFRTARAQKMLHDSSTSIRSLLDILVADESLYHQYIFDQQFSHQGWSGMVAVVEDMPQTLLVAKKNQSKRHHHF